MMDYEKFKKAITEMAQGFSDDITFFERIKGVQKLDAMTLKPSAGRRVTPVVYINNLYKDYVKLGLSVENMLDIAIKMLSLNTDSPEITAIEKGIASGELLSKDNIIAYLVPKDKHADYAAMNMCTPYLDMYVGYKIMVSLDKAGSDTDVPNATINLTKSLAEHLGIKESESFFEETINNTEKLLPAKIEPISAVIEKELREQNVPEYQIKDIVDTMDDSPLYIITNERGTNGAVTMLYKQNNPLKLLADKLGDDLLILPSSRHEIIAISAAGSIDPIDAKTMVTEINATELSAEDVLSDNVYLYHRDTGNISVAE